MWIDLDGNGTRFLNLNRATMVCIDKDDNSMKVYESLNGISDNRTFEGINTNEIIKLLRGAGNGRKED